MAVIAFSAMTRGANLRTHEEMKQIAWSILHPNAKVRGGEHASDSLRVVNQLESVTIVADGDNGFAILTNDAHRIPVVGYSHTKYDSKNLPEGFKWWLNAINHSEAKTSHRTRGAVPEEYSQSVEPLLITQWGQDNPFNAKCPYKKSSLWDETSTSLTGCVATAMAQVLYYYRYPLQGKSSHTYDDGSFDFANTVFEWGNMQPTYTPGEYNYDQAMAVANLMYACGVSVDMKYGVESSGASLLNVLPALKGYFGYEDRGELLWRSEYEGDWMKRVYEELQNGRPIIYGGTTNSTDQAYSNNLSHAFVIDGYNEDGFVHVNWGWSGEYDGYFDIEILSPYNFAEGYSENQLMIVNLRDYVAHPNLIVKSFSLSGKKIIGETVSLSLNLVNTGSNYFGSLYLFASTDGWKESTPIQTKSLSLDTDEEEGVSFTFNQEALGTYYLWVSTDESGKNIVGSITFNVSSNTGNIVFADAEVKKICVELWDSDEDGELSYAEAADVDDIYSLYWRYSDVHTFDEFKYFTGLRTIKSGTFEQSPLYRIILPESVEIIESGAFVGSKLESLYIPQNVYVFGARSLNDMFSYCSNLKEIIVSPDNPFFVSVDGVLYNKTKTQLMAFPSGKDVETFSIPEITESIEGDAFSGNRYLCDIKIGSNVSSIGGSAFEGCVSLKSIVIPDNVQTINNNAFMRCENLESAWIGKGVYWICNDLFGGCKKLPKIDVDPLNEDFCSVDGILMSKDQTILYQYPPGREGAVYQIPNGVSVYRDAFRECKYLETIVIPESITDLDIMFNNSTSIKYVNIPKWITTIPDDSFFECGIDRIVIPENVTTIGHRAFRQCRNLTSVSIPNSIKSIGWNAFYSANIKTVYSYMENPVPIDENTFFHESIWDWDTVDENGNYAHYDYFNAILFVPKGKVDTYKALDGWKMFKHILEIGDVPPGDANGDSTIDEKDIQEIVDYLMGSPSEEFNMKGADANGDNKVNVADIVEIQNFLKKFQY